MDKFSWKIQVQDRAELSYTQNVREVKFGDNYAQISGVGMNIDNEKWALSWTNERVVSLDILNFLKNHITKSFLWTNPHGSQQIYRVVRDSIKSTLISNNVMTISAEFEMVYSA